MTNFAASIATQVAFGISVLVCWLWDQATKLAAAMDRAGWLALSEGHVDAYSLQKGAMMIELVAVE